MIKVSLHQFQLVDRVDTLLDWCRGKRILHLGATDAPETETAIHQQRLLHQHLNNVAAYVVGMDNNWEMINLLATKYGITNIQYGDIENEVDYPKNQFDVIVAGEIFEHLNNPGRALDALRKIMRLETKLIITVPNSYALKCFCRAVVGHELIHPDHVLHHSMRTLVNLLLKHDFVVDCSFSFVNGGTGILARTVNRLLKIFPQLAEGIGVVCSLDKNKLMN